MLRWITLVCIAGLALSLNAYADDEKKPTGDDPEKKPKMAPVFTLEDTDGKKHSLADFKGKWVVLEWVNHGCPYVKMHYDCGNMQALQKKCAEKGVVWLSICSSAPGLQGHMVPAKWKESNQEKKTAAKAVLLDPTGKVGQLYEAKTTPHMFVVSPKGEIVYDGAIDENANARTPEQIKASKNYVSTVLEAVMDGKDAPVRVTKPYGCSVKYGKETKEKKDVD